MRIADFYAGIGAFSIGFEMTGRFNTVFAIDNDKYCKQVYDLNHDIRLTMQDINDVKGEDIPDFDVLLAGFSCQPFSIAGKQEGFSDERSNCFFSMLKLADLKKPYAICLENVKNLITHDNGKSFNLVISSLQKIGYATIFHQILNSSSHANIPQNRERLFIVAFRNDLNIRSFSFPEKTELTLHWKSMLDTNVPEKYIYTETSKIYDTLYKNVVSETCIYQYRRGIVRENKSDVCPTLVATMGTGGHNVPIIKHNGVIRKLTPRECFRLQGFSETFIFPSSMADSHLYKQIGNSMTVPLVYKIALEIDRVLKIRK